MAGAARRIQQTSRAAAALDVLASLAEAATALRLREAARCRDGDELAYVEGRHPIMERVLAEPFVANDLAMGDGAPRLFVLTGPNMGGKSTFLRQTALIVLMAQMGSFVPAREAKIGARRPHLHPRRRDATRSCAASPRSWSRCRRRPTSCATPPRAAWSSSTRSAAAPPPSTASRSPGRWPSTWRTSAGRRPRPSSPPTTTSSSDLAADLPGVGNLHVSAREWQDSVVFLRKIEPGGSDRSFGIQVARLAGLPAAGRRARPGDPAQPRADRVRPRGPAAPRPLRTPPPAGPGRQLALFAGQDEAVLDELRRADPDQLTPLQALALLAELQASGSAALS